MNAFVQALLRAKALECISLVGMAVGCDRFRADAHEVMKFMQALQQQELDPDDPTGGYMLQVLSLVYVMFLSHSSAPVKHTVSSHPHPGHPAAVAVAHLYHSPLRTSEPCVLVLGGGAHLQGTGPRVPAVHGDRHAAAAAVCAAEAGCQHHGCRQR
jgi:hypothetical protein